ncbi:MAG: cell division protein FtsQ/DivIB [Ignavibacteriales bacterium]
MVKKVKKKVKIRYRVILVFLLVAYLIGLLLYKLLNTSITNIYIYNNNYLTDQDIINQAGIGDYPATIKVWSSSIERKLLENVYISSVDVSKKNFLEVHIDVTENKPLFFYQSINKTVLLDGRTVDKKFNVPIVVNYVPDVVYSVFASKMAEIDYNVLIKISEIKYYPNEVDNSRFFLTMSDGNYVYLTANKFEKINNYLELARNVNNKKGIFYLDYGNKFDILEN